MDRDTIFISHATPHDNDFVRWLGERLTARGYAVWADVFHLKGGTPFWTSIEEVLRKRAVKVIFVVSSYSIDADRSGVRNELSVADGLRKSLKDPEFIVPLRIDGTPFDELPIQIHQLNTLDFSRDWDVGLPDLLDTLEYARVPRTSDEPNGLRGAAPASAISVVNKLTGDPDEVVDAPAEGHSPAALERPSGARASPSLAPSLPDKPSVAVMPFANLGGGPNEADLIEGLVDDIITELSRFKTFAVARVRDPAVDARRAMRDLGVRYVLEGSVRRAGVSLRVAAHLADAATGEQLWAERFDDTATGVLFDLQDRITEAVVGLLEPQIRQAEVERVRRKRPESLDAYELFLRALPFVYGMNPDGYAEGIALLDRAIGISPDFAPALAYAAWCYEKRITLGLPPLTPDDTKRCLELVQAALSHGRDDPVVVAICGWMTILIGRDASKGLGALRRAMAASPNNLVILNRAGYANLGFGDLAEASSCFRRAYRLSPGSPDAFQSLTGEGEVQVVQGNYEIGIDWLLRSLATFNEWVPTYWALSVAYAHAGRMAEAREAVRKILELTPHATVAKLAAGPFRDYFPPRAAVFIEGWRKAGLPEG